MAIGWHRLFGHLQKDGAADGFLASGFFLGGFVPIHEFHDRLGLPPGCGYVGNADRMGQRILLRRFEFLLHSASPFEGRWQLLQVFHNLPQMPVHKIGVVPPFYAVQVEEDAGSWPAYELIDLAADVSQIDVGAIGVTHVDRVTAPEVEADMPCIGVNGARLG